MASMIMGVPDRGATLRNPNKRINHRKKTDNEQMCNKDAEVAELEYKGDEWV